MCDEAPPTKAIETGAKKTKRKGRRAKAIAKEKVKRTVGRRGKKCGGRRSAHKLAPDQEDLLEKLSEITGGRHEALITEKIRNKLRSIKDGQAPIDSSKVANKLVKWVIARLSTPMSEDEEEEEDERLLTKQAR